MLPLLITLQYVADTKNSVLDRLTREEKGASAVEYGLLIGLIAVAIIAALIILGPKLGSLFSGVSGKLPTVS